MQTKVCISCGLKLPATKEYFQLDNHVKSGLKAMCKVCTNKKTGYVDNGHLERELNTYQDNGEYMIGHTKTGETFIFDAEYYDKIKDYTWAINEEGYVVSSKTDNTTGNRKRILLHRLIIEINNKSKMVIDHINRNKCDNRKSNLRVVTVQENGFNRKVSKNNNSGTLGVFYRERKGKKPKWIASINVNGKSVQLGQYSNKEDAIKARKDAELKYYNGMRYEEG